MTLNFEVCKKKVKLGMTTIMTTIMAKQGRPRSGIDSSVYSGAVAERLRNLVDTRSWSISDFAKQLSGVGVTLTCKCGKTDVRCRNENAIKCPVCGNKFKSKPLVISERRLYNYLLGKYSGGSDLPIDMFPVIAKVFGYSTPSGWLP